MPYTTDKDNIYEVGTVISAKEDAGTRLVIKKYYHRIYYCAVFGDDVAKQRVYFERELMAPENDLNAHVTGIK